MFYVCGFYGGLGAVDAGFNLIVVSVPFAVGTAGLSAFILGAILSSLQVSNMHAPCPCVSVIDVPHSQ